MKKGIKALLYEDRQDFANTMIKAAVPILLLSLIPYISAGGHLGLLCIILSIVSNEKKMKTYPFMPYSNTDIIKEKYIFTISTYMISVLVLIPFNLIINLAFFKDTAAVGFFLVLSFFDLLFGMIVFSLIIPCIILRRPKNFKIDIVVAIMCIVYFLCLTIFFVNIFAYSNNSTYIITVVLTAAAVIFPVISYTISKKKYPVTDKL